MTDEEIKNASFARNQRKDFWMITTKCTACGIDRPHRHMHDCAHGIPETHMEGSERFECVHCGKSTHVNDEPRNPDFVFILDKPYASGK